LSYGGEYNKEIEGDFWKSGLEATESLLVPGSLIVVYNYQPHKGAIKIGEHSEIVKKVVCKIEL
jgi:beta-galactosidase beta subunit